MTGPYFTTPREAAVWWVSQGIEVVPTGPVLVDDGRGRKAPTPLAGWMEIPAGADNPPGRLRTVAEVETFWATTPDAQIAVVLGNGIGCIDIDPKNLGPEGPPKECPVPAHFPGGFAETTKSGGEHLLFRYQTPLPPGEPTRMVHLGGKEGGYVDVLCGGLLFTSPSRYRNAPRGYEVTEWGEIPEFPSVYLALHASAPWLAEEWKRKRSGRNPTVSARDPRSVRLDLPVRDPSIRVKTEHALAALQGDPELSVVFREGMKKGNGEVDRSLTEWKIAAFLKQRGVAPSVAWEVVQACDHTKSPRDRRGTGYFIGQIWQKLEAGPEIDGGPIAPPPPTDSFYLTEFGNADRLLATFGRDIHFDVARGEWLVWDDSRWATDQTGVVNRYIERIVDDIRRFAESLPEGSEEEQSIQDAWFRWWKQSSTDGRTRAVRSVASSRAGVSVLPEHLDSDPWLLNCRNGTVDLRTGDLQDHSRGDLITRLCPVDYRPDAKAPTWLAFLRSAMLGSDELVTFLQQACGFSLTGLTSEQKFFILHGAGRNGKSTFLNALRMVLGDYARNAEGQTFLRQDSRHVRQDLAVLQGVRFCTTSEIQDSEQLDEDLVKRLTGGDPVTARFLYSKRETEFVPELKLWMAVNHRPQIRGQDDGIWRRVVLIPWDWQVPPSEVDPHFLSKLSEEREGILAWLVRGCQEYRREGSLALPEAIAKATSDYRDDSDSLRAFIEDCIVPSADRSAPVGDVYRVYAQWAKEIGQRPVSVRTLSVRLKERGWKQDRTKATRYWQGQWLSDAAYRLLQKPQREESWAAYG